MRSDRAYLCCSIAVGAGHILPSMKRYLDGDPECAEFRDCNLNNTRLIGVNMQGAVICGLVTNLVVKGIEVTEYVEAELDRRPPVRLLIRPDDVTDVRRGGGSCAPAGRQPWRSCGSRPASSTRP